MPTLLRLPNLSDPRLAAYANMRDAELAQRRDPLDAAAHAGLFVAEGELVLRRLIDSGFPVQSVLLAENRAKGLAGDLARLPEETPVYVLPQSHFNDIVGFNMHRGVLAIGRRTAPPPLADVLRGGGPILILEDLVNHDNLGGIFRNAAGLGGAGCGVVLSPRCADPLYRKSLRVSMGHVLTVPFTRVERWPGALDEVRAAGFEVVALTPGEGSEDLAEIRAVLGRRVALVLGSEGPGLTEGLLAGVDRRVRIAMPPGRGGEVIDSLNVGMAAGIALWVFGRP